MEELDRNTLLRLYETMVAIRTFEDRLLKEGKVWASSAGQEAVPAGVCVHLEQRDYVATNHRPIGHYIAKGIDPGAIMAEIFGKAGGLCKGKAGYMHMADLPNGLLGAYAIVGANMPLALGPALMASVKGTNQVSVVFFGDGASNQGTFHEAMNLASIWKLPVVFVCENNRYAGATPAEYAVSVKDIADRAAAYSMPGLAVDGQDVFAVYQAAGQFIRRAREGQGPSLLECKTYRYTGHYVPGDDDLRYRTAQEVEHYKSRDCIERFRKRALELKLLTGPEMEEAVARVRHTVDEAVQFANQSPYPDDSELLTDVYLKY